MAGPATLFQSGDHASRPAVTAGCVLYWCTDHEIFYRSNGSAWSTWSDLSGLGGGGSAVIPNLVISSIPPHLALSTPTALTANRAYIFKIAPTQDVTVTTAYWNCTASAGNLDFGIYNADFSSRLGSTGSFASPGTGARSQALTGSVALVAGNIYHLAFAASSTTLRVAQLTLPAAVATGGWNMWGREESALPLPASIAAIDAWEDGTVLPYFAFK